MVASVSSFGSLLAFTVVNIALLLLRFHEPDRERPFRVPVSIGRLSVPAALGALSAVVLLFQFDFLVYIVGTGVAVTGIAFYYLRRRLWSDETQGE